jgi:hypothetical protein
LLRKADQALGGLDITSCGFTLNQIRIVVLEFLIRVYEKRERGLVGCDEITNSIMHVSPTLLRCYMLRRLFKQVLSVREYSLGRI